MAHWLRSRFFFPLLALSIVAMALYLAWRQLIGPWTGPRLHLNLFLAWVPYFAALAAVAAHQRRPSSPWLFRVSFLAWFVFFPNAPYLVTDWRYLPGWVDELWYAMLMMTSFSLCGLFLAAISLYLVHTVVARRTSHRAGTIVAALAIGLSGLGVYLGRFIRLNTWDLITHPRTVISDVATAFRTHETHMGPIGFTVLFTLLLASVYYLVLQLRQAHWSREEVQVWEIPVRTLPPE
ncbi:MAG: DUF1361 domain-containing protein [Planctomycetia bacterium]|nr:DUF1361 domain-containing protein [Planctomycetia bacterium]